MRYTLITAKGQVFVFFIRDVAETYRQGLGGVIVTNDVLELTEIQ